MASVETAMLNGGTRTFRTRAMPSDLMMSDGVRKLRQGEFGCCLYIKNCDTMNLWKKVTQKQKNLFWAIIFSWFRAC